MNSFVFVIDGFGAWSDDHVATYKLLEDHFDFNPITEFPTLCELGIMEAKNGKGNLLIQKSVGVGSLEGHREMMGYVSSDEYIILGDGISCEILHDIENKYGYSCVGNMQGRGKQIIPIFWNQHIEKRTPILYSGLDSTVSIAFKKGMINIENVQDFACNLMITLKEKGLPIRKFLIREFENPTKKTSETELFHPVNFDKHFAEFRYDNIYVNSKIQSIFGLSLAHVFNANGDDDCFYVANKHISNEKNNLMFFNLGEFDEKAHKGDFESCLQTLRNIDANIRNLRNHMSDSDHLIITSDHGVSYGKSDLLFSHIKECTLFLLSSKDIVYYHSGINNGHELIYKTLRLLTERKSPLDLGFDVYN